MTIPLTTSPLPNTAQWTSWTALSRLNKDQFYQAPNYSTSPNDWINVPRRRGNSLSYLLTGKNEILFTIYGIERCVHITPYIPYCQPTSELHTFSNKQDAVVSFAHENLDKESAWLLLRLTWCHVKQPIKLSSTQSKDASEITTFLK